MEKFQPGLYLSLKEMESNLTRSDSRNLTAKIQKGESHPIVALLLLVKDTSIIIENSEVKITYNDHDYTIEESHAYSVLVYWRRVTQSVETGDWTWTESEYRSIYGISMDVGFGMVPEEGWLASYGVREAKKKQDNGQAKLLMSQLEPFVEEPGEKNVLVVGSFAGDEKGGMSYPEIAQVLEHRNYGNMYLVDIQEMNYKEKIAGYTLHHENFNLNATTLEQYSVGKNIDIVIYDKYDEEEKYVQEQIQMITLYPYKTFLLKIPRLELATRIKSRIHNIDKGLRCRIVRQVFYDREEVRMVVSKRCIQMDYQHYSAVTCSMKAPHDCETCKRIVSMAYRLGIKEQIMYDAVIRMGIRPCRSYDNQRWISIMAMVRQYNRIKRSPNVEGVIQAVRSVGHMIDNEHALMIVSYLGIVAGRRIKRKSVQLETLYSAQAPADYKRVFIKHPELMHRIVVRFSSEVPKHHWSYTGVNEEYSDNVEDVDNRCEVLCYPVGINVMTGLDFSSIIKSYEKYPMWVVIRDNDKDETGHDRTLRLPYYVMVSQERNSLQGMSTKLYRRDTDYTIMGNKIAFIGTYVIINGQRITKLPIKQLDGGTVVTGQAISDVYYWENEDTEIQVTKIYEMDPIFIYIRRNDDRIYLSYSGKILFEVAREEYDMYVLPKGVMYVA